MRTNTQTTSILLQRGSEDRALWVELNKIVADLKYKSVRDFIKKYPLINELKYNLKVELDAEDEE